MTKGRQNIGSRIMGTIRGTMLIKHNYHLKGTVVHPDVSYVSVILKPSFIIIVRIEWD